MADYDVGSLNSFNTGENDIGSGVVFDQMRDAGAMNTLGEAEPQSTLETIRTVPLLTRSTA